jgi:hypothetical protein
MCHWSYRTDGRTLLSPTLTLTYTHAHLTHAHPHSRSPILTLTNTPKHTHTNASAQSPIHSHPHVLAHHRPLTPDSNASGVGATSHQNHQAAGSPVIQGRRSSVPAWPSNETPLASWTPEDQNPTDRINTFKTSQTHTIICCCSELMSVLRSNQ